MPRPTIGRVVIYSTDQRNGLVYDLPAIITCMRDSHPGDYPDGRANPLPVPSSETHCHLTVLTPGGFGTKVGEQVPSDDSEFVGAPSITPGSGSYVEWDVPMGEGPRTWHWPVIVPETRPDYEQHVREDERARVISQADTASGGNLGLPSVGP